MTEDRVPCPLCDGSGCFDCAEDGTVRGPDAPILDCEKCGGAGKVRYSIASSGSRDLGDGVTITDMGGTGTRACSCVRDLPAIDGKATWWETETIYSEVVVVPIGNEAVEITADCEVPRDENGRRVHRTAQNAYYPPLIRLEMECAATLHSDTAREIAAALVAAADACDKADELVVATMEREAPDPLDIPF